MKSTLKYAVPFILFVGLVGLFLKGLKQDPKEVKSPLIGKPAPAFSLPQLHDLETMFSSKQMLGDVWVLNVWASWCVACRAEHELITELIKKHGIRVVGLNYKDENPDAKRWLSRLGDPYLTSVVDAEGKVGLDYGVYGVPESFVIDKKGIIRHKVIGPVSDDETGREDYHINYIVRFVKQLEMES